MKHGKYMIAAFALAIGIIGGFLITMTYLGLSEGLHTVAQVSGATGRGTLAVTAVGPDNTIYTLPTGTAVSFKNSVLSNPVKVSNVPVGVHVLVAPSKTGYALFYGVCYYSYEPADCSRMTLNKASSNSVKVAINNGQTAKVVFKYVRSTVTSPVASAPSLNNNPEVPSAITSPTTSTTVTTTPKGTIHIEVRGPDGTFNNIPNNSKPALNGVTLSDADMRISNVPVGPHTVAVPVASRYAVWFGTCTNTSTTSQTDCEVMTMNAVANSAQTVTVAQNQTTKVVFKYVPMFSVTATSTTNTTTTQPPTTEAPLVSISAASPQTVAPGGSTTISWKSYYGTSACTLTSTPYHAGWSGSTNPVNGSKTVAVNGQTDFYVQCFTATGVATQKAGARVFVTETTPVVQPPVVTPTTTTVVNTVVAPPTNVRAVSTCAVLPYATVTWTQSASATNGYKILRDGVVISSGVGGSSYIDSGSLVAGQARTYTVIAKGSRDSAPSVPATVTIQGRCTVQAAPAATPVTTCDAGGPCASIIISVTTGSSCGNKISISWTSVAGATRYEVYSAGNLMYDGPARGTVVTMSQPKTSYTFAVIAYGPTGLRVSSESLTRSALSSILCGSVPVAPANATATSACGATPSVAIEWSAVSEATSYRVRKDGIYVTSGVTGTSYTDTAVRAGQSVTYVIKATNAIGDSEPTPVMPVPIVVSGVCPLGQPPTPTGLTASPVCYKGSPAIYLAWDPIAGLDMSYNIYRNGSVSPTYSGIASKAFYDNGVAVTPGSTHTYRITSFNSQLNSSLTESVTATAYTICSN